MYTLVFLVAGLLGFALHLALDKRPRSVARVVELLLVYLLAVPVGLAGVLSFMGHFFDPVKTAGYIGWPAHPQFQLEVAFADLAVGVLGLLAIRLRGGFCLAAAVVPFVFWGGCAYGHLRDLHATQNAAPGNAGAVLFVGDILLPLVVLVLAIVYYRLWRRTTPPAA